MLTAFTPLTARAAVYQEEKRVRGYTYPMCVSRLHDGMTAGRLVRRLLPHWTKEMHLRQAQYHLRRHEKLSNAWDGVWARSFARTFGAPPKVYDYQVCAIGREELPEAKKRVLRHCAYSGTKHMVLARAHLNAARLHSGVSLEALTELLESRYA